MDPTLDAPTSPPLTSGVEKPSQTPSPRRQRAVLQEFLASPQTEALHDPAVLLEILQLVDHDITRALRIAELVAGGSGDARGAHDSAQSGGASTSVTVGQGGASASAASNGSVAAVAVTPLAAATAVGTGSGTSSSTAVPFSDVATLPPGSTVRVTDAGVEVQSPVGGVARRDELDGEAGVPSATRESASNPDAASASRTAPKTKSATVAVDHRAGSSANTTAAQDAMQTRAPMLASNAAYRSNTTQKRGVLGPSASSPALLRETGMPVYLPRRDQAGTTTGASPALQSGPTRRASRHTLRRHDDDDDSSVSNKHHGSLFRTFRRSLRG